MQQRLVVICFALSILTCAPAQAAPQWTISPTGVGPVKIGMSVKQASKASGVTIRLSDDDVSGDPNICAQVPLDDHEGIYLLFENQKLTSVIISAPSPIKTSKGIGVGSSDRDIKVAYAGLKMEAADFDEAPAQNLTYWIKAGISGVRFKTDIHRKVQFISAGGPSLTYTEGCL